MAKITIELVRKRSEHNEGEISTLEELSLHQEDLEKIEYLQNWCRDLKILYLQSNLISKIENLNKLKRLEYLNMALNNVERIENLEGCESLRKLDLTLNFVGELTSIENLKKNIHLESLFLTGNPCADYAGYRDFVIATLPQLQYLDSEPIERSHRIKAAHNYQQIRKQILVEQENYNVKRNIQKEKQRSRPLDPDMFDDPEEMKRYWSEPCENSPETRVELAHQTRKLKEGKNREIGDSNTAVPRKAKLFRDDGRPLNINEPRISFTLEEIEEINSLVLTLQVYKYLDTSLIDADVQPDYVKVEIKKKVFQITLPENVHPDKSTAQRSQTTGFLVITMPLVKKVTLLKKANKSETPSLAKNTFRPSNTTPNKRELLEIGAVDRSMDFSNIVGVSAVSSGKPHILGEKYYSNKVHEKSVSSGFEENPNVPPLE